MAWWQWLVGIILFIVALSVLIGIHELGHLCAAKLFHVYCFNYSIGFGPKLLSSKRSKKHETIWTLRAIPLGGFVSMYGEGVEVEEGLYIPPSRSLEGVARYKRGIIVSAGVFLNFILGFFLIFLHNACFPQIKFRFYQPIDNYSTNIVCSINDESKAKSFDYHIKDKDALSGTQDPITGEFILNNNIMIGSDKYILCFTNSISSTKVDPVLSDHFVLYKSQDLDTAINAVKYSDNSFINVYYNNIPRKEKDTTQKANEALQKAKNYVNGIAKNEREGKFREELHNSYKLRFGDDINFTINTSDIYKPTSSATIKSIENVELSIFEFDHEDESGKYIYKPTPNTIKFTLEIDEAKSKWKDNIGVSFKRHFYRYNAGEVFSVSWGEWCNANTAVFRGLGQLFTGSGDVGGIIRIAQVSSQTLSNFGFERYLYLWGMISCNLAILNLLPFPGLDGWTLVVTIYEGIRKKQIPTKVKNIVSLIGLGLLFVLMIFILIKDIIFLV